jgi:O-antigen ligase
MRSLEEWAGANGRRTRGERIYDALALLLLMWPATGGMGLMGSTRTWGYAPGLLLGFCGALLVLARPLIFRSTPAWRVPPGFWVLAVMAAYVAIRTPWAVVPQAARWEALRWSCLVAAAWSWTQMGGRQHRWKWLLGVLLLAGALVSLYALVQQVNGSAQVLWAPRPEQYGMRASGTYLCPNHFANMLAMLFPLALVLMLLPAAGFPLRLMALYFLGVATPALYWSQSRSGWGGMVAGAGVTLVLLAWRRSRGWLLVALVALPLLAGAAGGLAWKTLPLVRERIGQVLTDPAAASNVRIPMWRDAPGMIRERPVWGFGGGSFLWAYPPYQVHVRDHLTWDYLHNDFLQLLVEHGAVGLGLMLVGLIWAGAALTRAVLTARSAAAAALLAAAAGALAASLLQALFDFNFRIFPNPHALVWIGGVAWGVWFAHERGAEPVAARRRPWRLAVAAAGAAACGCGAWLALAGGLSYYWNLRGELARTRMDWEEVEPDYRKAMAWDSWNWRPHLGLGNLRAMQATWYFDPDLEAERAGKRRLAAEAVGHFQEALRLNPVDMAAEFGLARSLNTMGDAEGALEHYRRAATYQRRHVFYREQLGIQLRRMGREAEALEVFRQNVADEVASDVSLLNIRSLERRLAQEPAEGADAGP